MKNSGFTLVEAILTVVMLGILVAATGVIMGRGLEIYSLVGARTGVLTEGRYALVRMEKELEGLTDVQSTNATRIQFKDSAGTPTDFNLNGTNLYRQNDLLSRDINALLFTYYKSDGSVTASAPQTRRIQIELSVASPESGGPIWLRTNVFPKNFMYENYR